MNTIKCPEHCIARTMSPLRLTSMDQPNVCLQLQWLIFDTIPHPVSHAHSTFFQMHTKGNFLMIFRPIFTALVHTRQNIYNVECHWQSMHSSTVLNLLPNEWRNQHGKIYTNEQHIAYSKNVCVLVSIVNHSPITSGTQTTWIIPAQQNSRAIKIDCIVQRRCDICECRPWHSAQSSMDRTWLNHRLKMFFGSMENWVNRELSKRSN